MTFQNNSFWYLIALAAAFLFIKWASRHDLVSNLSLHHSQTSSFGIQGSICEPQACGDMLDETHGLSILYLWNAHALNIALLSHIHLLLLRVTMRRERVGEVNDKRTVGRITEIVGKRQRNLKREFWPLKPGRRMQIIWCWPSLGQQPTDPSPHPDTGIGQWWCGEYGKTAPTSCGYHSNCR